MGLPSWVPSQHESERFRIPKYTTCPYRAAGDTLSKVRCLTDAQDTLKFLARYIGRVKRLDDMEEASKTSTARDENAEAQDAQTETDIQQGLEDTSSAIQNLNIAEGLPESKTESWTEKLSKVTTEVVGKSCSDDHNWLTLCLHKCALFVYPDREEMDFDSWFFCAEAWLCGMVDRRIRLADKPVEYQKGILHFACGFGEVTPTPADIAVLLTAWQRILNCLACELEPAKGFATEAGRPLIGWVPGHVELDDELYVLHGVNIPLVLRRVDEGHLVFVGNAYIQGLMDGEAMRAEKLDDVMITVV